MNTDDTPSRRTTQQVGHPRAIDAFRWELAFLNDRVITGDFTSAKAGLVPAQRICKEYAAIAREDGLLGVSLSPYVGAGGLISCLISYTDIDGVAVSVVLTPKTI